ncbi:TolC family protein [Clostridium sp. C2-6-12]|uniref:TolC family protein n=1 Tax=Clostridium sp. C2-6-12 TaxID=2698832 RepID=UPI00136F1D03|nr:TolC family protein [Clostridium sp. C2-6-12]
MRKNINKLIAFAIGISVMSGTAIPVLAADSTTASNSTVTATTANTSTTAATSTNTSATTNAVTQGSNIVYAQNQVKQKPVLTLKDAINAAFNTSQTLTLKEKKIRLEEDKLDLQEKVNDDGYQYDSQELAVKQAKEDKEFFEDQIAQTVTDKYTDLVAKENELDKLKKQIEIKTKQLKDNELKKNLGLITTIDLKNAQNDLETQKNNIKFKEDQLNNNKYYFKVLTGKDLSEYLLEQDQAYEIFKIDGSVDSYFDKIIDKYLRYNVKSNELLKDYVKDIKKDRPTGDAPKASNYSDTLDVDGVTVIEKGSDKFKKALDDYNKDIAEYRTYLETRYNYNAATVGLDEKKKSYRQILKDSYAKLIDLENKINVMKSSVEISNKQLSNAKLKYDMGLITKTDYNNLVLDNDDLENNFRTAVNSYNTLKNQIQKPWLLVGGASSAN